AEEIIAACGHVHFRNRRRNSGLVTQGVSRYLSDMLKKSNKGSLLIVSAMVLAFSSLPSSVLAQTTQSAPSPATPTAAPATPRSRYKPSRFSKRAGEYYGLVWGVDSLAVKLAESGEVVKFTYRVLDANKAKVLNDK